MSVYTFDRAATARHEAGHVAGEVLAGRLPVSVSADRPNENVLGRTIVDFDEHPLDEASVPSHVIGLLLGPLAEGRPDWPPKWPLDPDAPDQDSRHLEVFARFLRLDETGWDALIDHAREIYETAEFKHLVNVIAHALERVDELDGEQIRFLVGPETCEAHGIPVKKETSYAT